MKRSKFTNYSYDETIIYEYMKKYYIMELCQQGELNPAHDNRQAPSDVCDLSSTYDSNSAAEKIGKGIIKALDNFDSRAHPYDKFDLPARGRYISGLVGARGLPSLERDSRQVVVKRQLEAQQLFIYPTDNNRLNHWIDLLDPIIIPMDSSAEKIGEKLIEAFDRSTWHPNKKFI